MAVVTDCWSDMTLQDPPSWYHGIKRARVLDFGSPTRALSSLGTGQWQGPSCTMRFYDGDGHFRDQQGSVAAKYWTEPVPIRLVDYATRAALGTPFTVFVGQVVSGNPTGESEYEIQLSDIVGRTLLTDKTKLPWRNIGDGFLNLLTAVSDRLDVTQPESTIYGRHIRLVDIDSPSPDGFAVSPTYLGIQDVSGTDMHCWLVCGHAVADIMDVNVVTRQDDGTDLYETLLGDEGTQFLFPHHPGFNSEFGQPYRDFPSSKYPTTTRRYTLIYGLVGGPIADAIAKGDKGMVVSLDGVESNGDGTGEVIRDGFQCYKHWLINYVANYGINGYQSGPWLANPEWDVYDALVPIVDTQSFDDATEVGEFRLPLSADDPTYPAGYICAAIIGSGPNDTQTIRDWIAHWNRSFDCRLGVTRLGRLRIVMMHPTDAIKAAAPRFTDVMTFIRGTFATDTLWDSHYNHIPFKCDLHTLTGTFRTTDVAVWQDAVDAWGFKPSDIREYRFAPGITMGYHIARQELLRSLDPPRVVSLEGLVDSGLAELELGDYVNYESYKQVGTKGVDRLGQVQAVTIMPTLRRVRVDVLDCEDLIGVDQSFEELETPNDTCEAAIDITQLPFTPVAFHIDTTAHATDSSVLPGGVAAYHAAWWTFTPWADGTLFVTTVHSRYNTKLALYTGSCGALSQEAFNDDDGTAGGTSSFEVAVLSGVTYHILAAGVGPDDGGELTLGSYFTE